MFQNVPKGVLLAGLSCVALLAVSMLAPEWAEQYLLPVIAIPGEVMAGGLLLFFVGIPHALADGDGLFLLLSFLFCFVPAFLMRWRLPVQSKHLTKCWPVVCFLWGIAYCMNLYGRADLAIDVSLLQSFYLWMLPALAGLAVGKVTQEWK